MDLRVSKALQDGCRCCRLLLFPGVLVLLFVVELCCANADMSDDEEVDAKVVDAVVKSDDLLALLTVPLVAVPVMGFMLGRLFVVDMSLAERNVLIEL